MKKLTIAIAAVASTAALASARADVPAQSAAVCTFQKHVRFSRALSQAPGKGWFRTTRAGGLECTGAIGGRLLDSSPGALSMQGFYGGGAYLRGGDDCALGWGSVSFSARLPLLSFGGRQFTTVRGSLEYQRVGAEWNGGGRAKADYRRSLSTGLVAHHRADGGRDCFNKPVREALLQGRLVIRD